jgi:hypothetical protein
MEELAHQQGIIAGNRELIIAVGIQPFSGGRGEMSELISLL